MVEAGPIELTFDTVVQYCLVYLKSHGKVLLIRKSHGRLHEGQWIGLGGKLEPGEEPVGAAIREFREESGLILEDPRLAGTFVWIDEAHCGVVHIVAGTRWSGELSESEEGELRWHRVQDLPKLECLAKHQRLFLDRVLLGGDNFYSAVMVFHNGEMVKYMDSDTSSGGR